MQAFNTPLFVRSTRWRAAAWRAAAWCGLGLGAVGAVLPLLPTTPFLLIAAWAAPKGSPRLNKWLHCHPKFGPLLYAWREQRAVPARAKLIAVLLLMLSWAVLWIMATSPMVLGFTGVLFAGVAIFLLSRPNTRESVYE